MKRWKGAIIKCLVFLLLGAAVNVAVAWGCAVTARPDRRQWEMREDEAMQAMAEYSHDAEIWSRSAPYHVHLTVRERMADVRATLMTRGFAPTPMTEHREFPLRRRTTRDVGFRWRILSEHAWPRNISSYPQLSNSGQLPEYAVAQQVEAGLPYLALHGERWDGSEPDPDPYAVTWRNRGVLDLQDLLEKPPSATDGLLPLFPRWPGFAINTVFYAAILWLLFCGPFALWRGIRRWRGRCPKCGYDLRGDFDAGCPECGWNRADEVGAKV